MPGGCAQKITDLHQEAATHALLLAPLCVPAKAGHSFRAPAPESIGHPDGGVSGCPIHRGVGVSVPQLPGLTHQGGRSVAGSPASRPGPAR